MKEIKKVLFVVNPISGNNNKDALVDFVKKEVEKRQGELFIYVTEGENDAKNIKEKCSKEDPDRILVAGGDGTIKMVAEIILNINVPIGIFPEGSANGLALNLNIPHTYEKQLKVALGEDILNMDALMINENLSLHLADFGINAELIENYEKANLRGKIGYLIQSIPTLIKSDYPYEFEIKTEKGTYSKTGLVLAIANCQKYGTGAMINPNGVVNDGVFEIIIFKSLNIIDIVKTLTENTTLNPDFAEIFTSSSATIKCKKPVPFQVDGEYIGELEGVEVSVLKSVIQIAVPSGSLEA
ncbi:MAG: YegS/Rv2252/BmrU family lipid kinase [Brumimicrobium sp.]